ncbi:MAG: ABC transporter permease [Bacteroidales bacterium]|nr:ABC transporter permease [Tenuifilaceae bacterium]
MLKALLNIERIKTLHSPTFRAIIILHAALFLLVSLIGANLHLNIQGITIEKLFQFPHIWNTIAWIASWFNLILGVLAIMLVTNEFQYRTFRKQLIDGLSRNQLLYGKLLVFITISAYAMLLVLICGIIIGVVKSNGNGLANITQGLEFVPILFLQTFGYLMLALLFGALFQNTALSIVAYILYFFPIEPIIRTIIPEIAAQYMPVKVIANLTPMPDFAGILMGDMIQINSGANNLSGLITANQSTPIFITALIAFAYCILLALGSKAIFHKKNF